MPSRTRLVVGLLAAAIVATAGCILPVIAPDESDSSLPDTSQSQPPAVPGTRVKWRSCPSVPRQLVGRGAAGMRYDCASVAVPRNWATPRSGETYEIFMIRIRSDRQADRIGSLVINPGGPGVSGVDYAVFLSFGQQVGGLPTAVTDRFDIVGFDPRGVGRSNPVKCISDDDQDKTIAIDPDPFSKVEFDEAVELNRRIATGCGAKYGDQLPLFATEQAAHDMDGVRTAVGDAKLTYLGYSYGTLLGATYAQLYPRNIRALVLDGAVNPAEDFVGRFESQAKGFERAFANFTDWCEQSAQRCPIAPDARGAIIDAMEKARSSPVRGKDGRDTTAGWIFLAVVSSLYHESGWATLAKAVDSLQAGNPEGIFDLADQYADRRPDGTYSNQSDANLTVNCADTDEAPTVEQIRELQGKWRKKYPMFGAALAIGMLPCTFWPGGRDPYPVGPATGSPPIVVVGTTGDPATPYENTAELAGMLGTGQVLTWEGEGHTAYAATRCITNAVNEYLIDLTVPKEGLRCPAR